MRRSVQGFPTITIDPAVMGGKPCIRGMRVTVGMILGNLRAGVSIERLLDLYPYIEREDVLESLRLVAQLDRKAEVELLGEIYGSTDPADIGELVLGALRRNEADLAPGSIVMIENDSVRIRRGPPTISPMDKS